MPKTYFSKFFGFSLSLILTISSFFYYFSFFTSVSATITSLESLAKFTGESSGEQRFGNSISSAGDVNGDGYGDVIVGAPYYDNGNRDGRAYIFFGSESPTDLSAANANVIYTYEEADDEFGGSVSTAGDMNGDGYDDVIIGARYGGSNPPGRAYIFFGGSTISSKNLNTGDTADVTLKGTVEVTTFGSSVSSAGDFNHDGYDDVMVFGGYAGLKSNQGRVYVFYGSANINNKTLDEADVIFTGEGVFPFDRFGFSLASAGDVNRDGYDDIIIGAKYGGDANQQGRAYIFYGSLSPQSKSAVDADVILTGEANGDSFGISVDKTISSAGDVNGDGYDDVIVGAPFNDHTANAAGRAYIFYGSFSMSDRNAASADVILTGEANNDRSGFTVSSAGDINNDGYDDVLISGFLNDRGGNNSGAAYVLYGGSSLTSKSLADVDIILTGENIGDQFGYYVSSGGDFNNDGWREFFIATSDLQGKTYLFNLGYGSPTISVTNNVYIQTTSLTITGLATETVLNVLGVQISVDSDDWIACDASDGAFDSASENYSCLLSGLAEGSHSVRVRSYDVNNVYIPSTLYATDDFIVDTTSPTGTISINSNETITNTDEVTLTLSATDNLSGISKMMVSNKGDYSGGTWETYDTSKEWRLSMGDGEKKVYVKYRDEVGNISSSYSDSIEMDMGAPTGTLIINEGEEYTSSREVVLHITGEDLPAQAGEVTGVEEMRISEDRTMEGVDWEGYETSREYTLSEGDGYKVIYIQYRDGIGNESEVYGSNITLDSQTEIDITEIGEEEVEGEITEWETEETTPTFTGEGEVGATITIEIEGVETGTVIVNEDGVWSWTPSIELTRGQEYNVTITSTDLAGNEDIQTFTLEIADEEVIDVNQTTPEAQTTTTQLPNTGMILIIGLMVMGGLLWIGMNFKVIEKLKKAHGR